MSHQEGIGIFIFNAAAIMGTRGQTYWNFWHLQELRPSCAQNLPTHEENQLWQWPSGEPQGGQRGRQVVLNILQLADSTLEFKFNILIFVFTFIWLFADFVTFSPSATVSGSMLWLPHSRVRKWRCSCLSSSTHSPVLSVYLQASPSIDDCPMSY